MHRIQCSLNRPPLSRGIEPPPCFSSPSFSIIFGISLSSHSFIALLEMMRVIKMSKQMLNSVLNFGSMSVVQTTAYTQCSDFIKSQLHCDAIRIKQLKIIETSYRQSTIECSNDHKKSGESMQSLIYILEDDAMRYHLKVFF